ncbi:VOC family protein [Salegentibacter salegens]|uniref:Catechol 2,3-dioxygenase n=1 Tax=Salegentibacter salegens TaxID=143223 RepID=A0A1M7IJH9_9FLAO|nr:VOC family protein [Salegentibacter salegens]PRX40407.1 catechol 2,3-dioxygenase-like lactoylglutathione lyase family enzyme [Salegentibacter salegens]SHM40743.1 Catechol 2,3-dioxygenase [Salegentibacter salegens]
MQYSYSLICTLLFTCFCSAQTNYDFKKDHDALLVHDLEISANFYQDVLGLKEVSSKAIPSGKRWFELGNGVQLHLSESKEEVPKSKSIHMAITTQKIDAFVDFLKSKDIYFENWAGKAKTVRVRADGVKQFYIRDPDGYWIEVNNAKM